MEYHQLACPYCAGEFSAAAATENHTSNCPHCDREVTVPAVPAPAPPASSPPPTLPLDPPTPVAAPPRRPPPAERARFRRRLNVVVAIGGMAILAIALWVLLRLRP